MERLNYLKMILQQTCLLISLLLIIMKVSLSEIKKEDYEGKYIIDGNAKSAARVVYDYYGGKEKFKRVSDEIMIAVDKGDSADFTEDEDT